MNHISTISGFAGRFKSIQNKTRVAIIKSVTMETHGAAHVPLYDASDAVADATHLMAESAVYQAGNHSYVFLNQTRLGNVQ